MDQTIENLLEYLKRSRGFDVTAYKRPSLQRRVAHRMQAVGAETFADYTDYLEVHPDEFAQLFNAILINVTGFYRDPASWDYLVSDIVPRIIAGKTGAQPIRVWTAGCASGEEAYTAAMVFAEALGPDHARARVKIYATDLNEGDLAVGRQATYKPRDLEAVPAPLRDKYFSSLGQYFAFDPDIRRLVVFGRHDLLQDSPISHIDLLICRNTLMYFNAEAQVRVLHRFHFALNDDGFLFLGKAEMLLAGSDYFTPLDLKRRIFVKNPARRHAPDPMPRAPALPRLLQSDGELPAAALQSGLIAQLVIDVEGKLAAANDAARRLFSLGPADLTRPISELPFAHRPVDLAAALEDVAATGRPAVFRETAWPGVEDEERVFDIQVAALAAPDDRVLGFSASFANVTPFKRLRETLQQVNEERETTHEELQTTNEELQSTVEELETTNEELQSTNEELETMNEELQSTNEELRSANEQLRSQSNTLEETRSFWESVMTSLGPAVVIVDPAFNVLVWNDRASELWGLRPDEVRGRNLLTLDIGLPVDRLRQPIHKALNGDGAAQALALPGTNRRGKPIECRVTCSALAGTNGRTAGVILLVDEAKGGAP